MTSYPLLPQASTDPSQLTPNLGFPTFFLSVSRSEERLVEIEQSERTGAHYAERLNPQLESDILASTAAEIVES